MFRNTNWYPLQQQHDKFLVLYRQKSWVIAEKFANDLKAAWPEMADYYDVMINRIHEYQSNPPAGEWDGVYRATTK